MSLIRRVGDDESGVTLVLVTLLMLVLLGFAAFAVDLGYQDAQRRQAQGAVDVTVLAAAVTSFEQGGDLQAVVDDIVAFADVNTTWSVTAADWTTCSDPDQLQWTAAELGLTPATDCVSFSGAFGEVRAQLPTVELEPIFAGAVGIQSLPVTAAAQASIVLPGGTSTPPFALLAGTGAGQEVCLRTSSSGSAMPGQWVGNGVGNAATQTSIGDPGYVADPCDELVGSSQFFGTLLPYFYDDIDPDSSPDTSCRSGSVVGIDVAIADGIDHNLSSFEPDYTPGAAERIEGDGCPQGPATSWPNTMDLQSGFTAQILRCGLLSTGSGTCDSGPKADGVAFTPRLQRGFYPTDGSTHRFAGEDMENRPLWSFIRSDIGSVPAPASCSAVHTAHVGNNPAWDYFDRKEAMLDCLTAWSPTTDGPIFSDALVEAGRFGFIPLLAESSFSSPPVHFDAFAPVFFQKLYQAGNRNGSPPPECFSQALGVPGNSGWYWHEAGQGFDCGRSNQNVDRLAAIVLDCGMLPATTCTPDVSPPSPGGDPVYTVRLTE